MKDSMEQYPTYKRGEVQKAYKKLPAKEKKKIEDFLKYVSITSQSSKRLSDNQRSITEFRMITGKSLDNVGLEDLRHFLSLLNGSNKTQATRNDLKASIKRFLKWSFKDWSSRFDNLSDVRLVMRMNEQKINADTLLKKEDIEKTMKTENNFFWKTFFITLYESGLRPCELRTLKWSNIKFNVEGELSELNIFATKTHRARSSYVNQATFFLKEQKRRQQQQELNTDFVFPAPKNKDKPINKDIASKWISKITKRAIGRSVTPYNLRHSRATELYINANIPDKIAQKFLGHSKSMSDVYTHLSNKDIKEALSKTIYNFQEVAPEKKAEFEEKLKAQQKQIEELKLNQDIAIKEALKKFEQQLEQRIIERLK